MFVKAPKNDSNKQSPTSLLACLELTPYDELVEFDLSNNKHRNLCHKEEYYFVPVLTSSIDAILRFAIDNMVHPDDKSVQLNLMEQDTMLFRLNTSDTPGMLQAEVRYKMMDGSWHWTREILIGGSGSGLPGGIVRCYMYDIDTRKKKEQQQSLVSLSTIRRDERTGLLTEKDLFPLTRKKMESMQGLWCVIAIDIEHFKLFTDWHGKDAADLLLAQAGRILRRVELDTEGLAGYRGLDDFWLVMPYDQQMIHSLYEELKELIVSHGNSVGFMPIFGICMINDPSEEVTDLFNHAAMTAEQVKGDLHNRIRVYNPYFSLQEVEEYRMLADFQRGLEEHELIFYLQPQCMIPSKKIVGAEALARWKKEDGTMIPPVKFIPILEKYGMIPNLDQYIWEEVCAWQRSWIDAGYTPIPVSMNISRIDILTMDVPAHFAMLLEKYRLSTDVLKLEITESAYVSDAAIIRDTVRRLRKMGFPVLMDDFGSGYSSLNMLRSLNVDVIKLDAQFLRISESEERKGISILESIINMTKTMKLPVIVEGVETQEQTSFLADLGCRYMQGYYFYRPVSVTDFEKLICDPSNIDLHGFEFKSNTQIHPREILDENVFSDAMLNNLLGPMAIYLWKENQVSIIRYNQQFYMMVGISVRQLSERSVNMIEYIYPEDQEKLISMLDKASKDHLNGSKGILRVYRPNGTLCWISLQLYFIEDTNEGKTFYASCEDVTELQYVSSDLPGGYYRCSTEGGYEFRYVSQNFQEITGYTAQNIEERFQNQLIYMVHPDDREILNNRVKALLSKKRVPVDPFRMKCKGKGYIYVSTQSILTGLSEDLSFMSVVTDVTEMVKLRNQMQLLAKYSSDSIILCSRKKGQWKYQIIVHGLEEKLGLSKEQLKTSLKNEDFYEWVCEPERSRIRELMMQEDAYRASFDIDFTASFPGKKALRLHLKADSVNDDRTNIEYICMLSDRTGITDIKL